MSSAHNQELVNGGGGGGLCKCKGQEVRKEPGKVHSLPGPAPPLARYAGSQQACPSSRAGPPELCSTSHRHKAHRSYFRCHKLHASTNKPEGQDPGAKRTSGKAPEMARSDAQERSQRAGLEDYETRSSGKPLVAANCRIPVAAVRWNPEGMPPAKAE